jgi:hypothetical protein
MALFQDNFANGRLEISIKFLEIASIQNCRFIVQSRSMTLLQAFTSSSWRFNAAEDVKFSASPRV